MLVNNKKSSSDEEESELIINNDEFCSLYDFKLNEENLIKINKSINSKKINSQQKNKILNNNCIILKKPKNTKISPNKINKINSNKNNIKNNLEEKTIFSKIAEDLYIDYLNDKNPKKNIIDLNKEKDDNYNKLTVENYLYTCADKENSKNKKIIKNFIERKTKEQIYKKISIIKLSQNDLKNLGKDKKLNRSRGKSRSPEKFLDDQKILEEKHKNYIDKLIMMHNKEINLCLKDKPTISKNSERLAKMNKDCNKSVHLKLYEEFNTRKKNIEELNDKILVLEEYYDGINMNKKMEKEKIIENSERLYQEYEKKKNIINENQIKQLNDIKNMSATSLIDKNSSHIIYKRFINIYKNVLKQLFQKNISDNFNLGFGDFLLFIYKLGLVEKNYGEYNYNNNKKFKHLFMNILENINKNNINGESKIKIKKNIINKIFIKPYSYRNDIITTKEESKNTDKGGRNISQEENKNIKNKLNISYKILKRNTFLKNKSLGRKFLNTSYNSFENDFDFKLTKDAWKIITKSKEFDEKVLGDSKNILLFFLSLCGIYKDNINDIFIKKEFPFLFNESNISIDTKLNIYNAKYIYKYFYMFRNCIINNVIEKNNTKKIKSKIKNIELNTKIGFNSKSFIKRSYNTNMTKIDEKKIKKIIFNPREKKEYKSFYKPKNNYIINTDINSKENKISKNCILNTDNNIKENKITKKKQNNKKNKIFTHKNRMTKIIMEKKEKEKENQNILNNSKLKKIVKIDNQKNNSNSSFNSNSLFSQKNFKPQLKKDSEKEIKENYINKSINEDNDDNEEHTREKKSSISQYIFNEDYRIKDDIESNSNYNDTEMNKNQNIKNINENNNNINNDNNYVKSSNSNLNKSSLNDDLSINKINNKMVAAPTKKKKFIFKIKIKDELIKLVINIGDDIQFKINEFCKKNNLDEEDKEQIIEAVNLKILGSN